jgi:hypothetical protein
MFMIGNIQPSHPDYNPLSNLQSFPLIKVDDTIPQAFDSSATDVNLQNDIAKYQKLLDAYLVNFKKELGDRKIYIFNHPILDKVNRDKLIKEGDDSIEIEPMDFQNREKALKAMQDAAFVAIKNGEAKFHPKWADYIEQRHIKRLKVKNEVGEIEKIVDLKELEVARFTPEEVNTISILIFKVVDVSCQIRVLEQQQKEMEKERKKEHKEMDNQARRFREETAIERFKELIEDLAYHFRVANRSKKFLETDRNDFDLSLILEIMEHRREKLKEQEKIASEREKQARIIKKDIEYFELKKEIISYDRSTREIF